MGEKMNRIFEIFLKNYNPEEKELFLKAKFALVATVLILLSAVVIIGYSLYLNNLSNILLSVQVFSAILMIAALGILIKGNYGIAIHTIFISTFSALWVVIFFDLNSSTFAMMDTVVLVIGLSAAMPIAFFKNRKPIVMYFIGNAILFLIFNYYLKENANLTFKEHLDYILDYSVTIVFVFLISFNAFAINQQALISLTKELQDRKKAEKDLLESRNQLSEHLKNTPVGAIFWDLSFRVTEWNPSAEAIFGYTKDEVMGKHPQELIIPEDEKKLVDSVFRNLLAGSGGERSINYNITKNRRRILCEWYNTILKNVDGRTIGVASLVNDITERKKTQEMIIQSEKMMSLGGLAAGMAHEINNPLAGIMQNAQVVYNRLAKDLPANNKAAEELGISMSVINRYMEKRGILNQLTAINQACGHAVKIIENMLSFSRKNDANRKEVDLEELLDSTIELANNHYDMKKGYDFRTIKICREYGPDLPKIFCQKNKIQQVLLNLLKNASESMNTDNQGGESPKIILRLIRDPKNARIEVQDNGRGMNPETCKHIFEPFFTTKADKGTGLGLSISYYIIVNDHGGQFEVESTPGKGTRFIIKLPFRHPDRENAAN